MLKLVLSALFGLTLAAHSVQGQQKSYTLGELWPEVEKKYPGIQAKQSAIQSAEFNEKAVKSKALPETHIQFQNTYGTFEGNNGGFFPQPGFSTSTETQPFRRAHYQPPIHLVQLRLSLKYSRLAGKTLKIMLLKSKQISSIQKKKDI